MPTGCRNKESEEIKNEVTYSNGDIFVNGEKCEVLEVFESERTRAYTIHANIDWELSSFRETTNSYKEATKEVIIFFSKIYEFNTKDYRVTVRIINNNKDYHYNRIAFWQNSVERDGTVFSQITWHSNSLSNPKFEIWAP